MINNIVFDMGGVLAKIHPERAIRSFEAIGVSDAADLINPYNHSGLFADLERGTIDADEFVHQLSAHCGHDLDPADVRRAWLSIANPAEVEKLDYILRLRPRYRLYVLSNNNPIVTGWARTSEFSAAGRPVTDYFDRLYISYEMHCMKPEPEIFQRMIEDSGMVPAETLFIDDGAHHLVTARSLGFHTLLATNGSDWRPDVDRFLSENNK